MGETRVPLVPTEEWTDGARDLLGFLRRPELYRGPNARPTPNVLGLLANHPPVGHAWLAFNDVLVKQTSLDARFRELLVLRVAWRSRSAYEWIQHTRMALDAGLSVEHLHAVPEGSAASIWTDVERALLDATDQLIDRHTVEDATWDALARHFEPAVLLEVLFVAGSYLCFAVITNAAALAPDAAAEVVDAPALPSS